MQETRFRFDRLQQLGLVALLAVATFVVAQARAKGGVLDADPAPPIDPAPQVEARIEVAFVLDTTGSMSGLIEGAKQKIWAIANQMASNQQGATVRMALIGYRDRGDAYVTRRFDLSPDIDAISGHLRAFQAAGGGDGPESVNQALREAVHELSWSDDEDVYRVIFLVGDAPPHTDYPQDVQYAVTTRQARSKGIVVNTIQCGGQPTTTPIWREIAGLGLGQYASIAQDGGMVALASPLDEELAELNRDLAGTVVVYGGKKERALMAAKVENSVAAEAPAAASRLSYLSKVGGRVVSGMSDLVDAVKDGVDLDSVGDDALPAPMRPMSSEERKRFVEGKLDQREKIQDRIDELSVERDSWVKAEMEKQRLGGAASSFDAEVYDAIRSQAAAKGIVYE